MPWTIYCHTHIESGRRYIGLTSRTMERRWSQHCIQAKFSKGGRWHFPNAIRKYGKDAFSHDVLQENISTIELANCAEKFAIEFFCTTDPEYGFNIEKGGGYTPHPFRNPWEDPEYVRKRNVDPAISIAVGLKFGRLTALSSISARTTKFTCDCGRIVKIHNKRVIDGDDTSCGKCGAIPLSIYRKFGKLRIVTDQEVFPWSFRKVEWICDCGRMISRRAKFILSGRSTSCGKCSLISASQIENMKFGKLRMIFPRDFTPGSNDRVKWICDCGKSTISTIVQVISGKTKSCGKCSVISAAQLESMKFGKLRIKHPQDLKPGSGKKVEWTCDCGRESFTIPLLVFRGNSTSCGKCNILSLGETSKKFGNLRMKEPEEIRPGSGKRVCWVCDCGKEIKSRVVDVISGDKKTCGQCSILDADYWASTKFGKLKMKIPQDMKPRSHKRVDWECDCGVVVQRAVQVVTNGRSRTCGGFQCKKQINSIINKSGLGFTDAAH